MQNVFQHMSQGVTIERVTCRTCQTWQKLSKKMTKNVICYTLSQNWKITKIRSSSYAIREPNFGVFQIEIWQICVKYCGWHMCWKLCWQTFLTMCAHTKKTCVTHVWHMCDIYVTYMVTLTQHETQPTENTCLASCFTRM